MISYSDRKRVHLWTQEALFKAEDEKLLDYTLVELIRASLTVEWSNRMARCIGTAQYLRAKGPRIRLSSILWAAAPEKEKRETVFHELAHIIVSVDKAHNGRDSHPKDSGRRSIHGTEWRYVMHKLGYPNASRCHDVVNAEYERARGKFPIHCSCKVEPRGWVSYQKARVLVMGRATCRHCKGLFSVGK